MQNKTKNCIQQATTTYLLSMSSEENKINTNENENNIETNSATSHKTRIYKLLQKGQHYIFAKRK